MTRRSRGGWAPLRRFARRTAAAFVLALLALTAAGAGYLLSLPGVSDAPARFERLLALHHESPRALPTPTRLVDAVVAVEDEHFYDNVVVNVLTGAGRAALAALHTSSDPGGSTIDQQLAKALYGRSCGVAATLREIGLGIKLAASYSKAQIMRMYLNAAYYGNGNWGVEQAARGYFATAPAALSWGEASLLAGLLQAPSAYDPLVHPTLARRRQRHVLDQLVANHYLTRAQARAAYAAPLPLP